MRFTDLIAGVALLSGFVAAHPGHDIKQEIEERREFLDSVKRTSLAHCAEELKARGVTARNVERRMALLDRLRMERGIDKRSLSDVLNTDHNETTKGYTSETDPATLFAGYKSCLLTPEVTQGPYYVSGEFVRKNVVEKQVGVSLLLDYQVINVRTCQPVPNVYVEIWHTNATGVYGGINANGNGNANDKTNINNTWLRGLQATNTDGVAQFQSIFPGHYTGRTAHIHIMVHTNATLLANGTLGSENWASHVGQAFFDQTLITAAEKTSPYTTNKQSLTTNAQDGILAQEAATNGVDPVMEYTHVGKTITDGLFAWLAFGIDPTRSSKITPAVYYYKEGGVANPNGGGGPGK